MRRRVEHHAFAEMAGSVWPPDITTPERLCSPHQQRKKSENPENLENPENFKLRHSAEVDGAA
jgi:hypothetical protein